MRHLVHTLIFGVCLAMAPELARATGFLSVSFNSKDVVHLAAAYTPAGEGYTSVRLVYGSAPVVVGTYPGNEPLDIPVRVEGLAFNTEYQFRLQGWNPDTETWNSIFVANKRLQSVEGSLLFDETLSDLQNVLVNITVPEGISCGLSGYRNSFEGSAQLIVYGSVGIADPETSQPYWIHLYNQHVLQLPAKSYVWVHPGAQGSAFVDTPEIDLYVNADDIRVRDCQTVRIREFGTLSSHPEEGDHAGLFSAERCGIGGRPGKATQRMRFVDCRVDVGEWSAGTVVFEKCIAGRTTAIGEAVLDATGSEISLLQVGEEAEVAVSGCYLGSITCTGDPADPDAVDCLVMDSEILYGVSLLNGAAGEIRDCVLGEALSYSAGTSGSRRPVITGNSFLGYTAISWNSPASRGMYDIGPNFYGDRFGPVFDEAPSDVKRTDFLSHRGGKVNAYVKVSDSEYRQMLSLAEPLTTGKYFQHFNPLPQVWVAGWIAGQNTLSHELYSVSGSWNSLKQTLVCVDLVASTERVDNIEVYGMLGSIQRLDPINGPVVLTRDSGKFNSIENLARGRTVAFLLPPAENNMAQTLNLIIDRSRLTGYDMGPPTDPEYKSYITIENPPTRRAVPQDKLRIIVQPVKLNVWFYPRDTPDGFKFAKQLEEIMAAMFPVRREELEIVVNEPYNFYGAASTFSVTAMLNGVATELALQRELANATATETIDYVIAVLAPDAMGSGTTGASLALRRSVIIVDESDPMTTVHEMGHALDLYNGWGAEQYDVVPPTGIDCASMTAFINVEGVHLAGFDPKSRFRHFPALNNPLAADAVPFADIMGGGNGNKWPVETTLAIFDDYLFNRLYRRRTKQEGVTAGPEEKAAQSGIRNLVISAVIERADPALPASGRLQPHTFRVMNMGETLTQNRYLSYQQVSEGFRIIGEVRGTPRYDEVVYPPSIDPNPAETDLVFGRTSFPDGYDRLTIRSSLPPNQVLASIPAATLNAQFESLEDGDTIGETETIRWNVTGTSPGITQVPGPGDVLMPFQSFLFVKRSADSGWRLVGTYENKKEGVLSTAPYRNGETLSLRIHVTDGFQSSTDEIHNVVIGPRAPQISIVTPDGEARIDLGTLMFLQASFWTPKGTVVAPEITWNSSIDGSLGTGLFLENVPLSEGTHLITATATSPGGLSSSHSVRVIVGPVGQVDFAVLPDGIQITGPGLDPTSAGRIQLQVGGTYRATAVFRNAAVFSAQTLRIGLLRPSAGVWEILEEKVVELGPSETAILAGNFVVSAAGEYQFRAEIVNSTPPDSNSHNNQRTVVFSTEVAPPHALASMAAVDFGRVFANMRPTRHVAIGNLGEADLQILAVSLSGTNPQTFEILSAPSPGTVVSSGDATTISIRPANEPAPEVRTATLVVHTNDPLRPAIEVGLRVQIIGSATSWLLN